MSKEPIGEGNSTVENAHRPLLFETIRAYRHWDLKSGILHAPHHGSYPWVDGENVAYCGSIDKPSTECAKKGRFKSCTCGFYSVWSARNQYARESSLGTVFGVIELYGNVTLGPNGARATKARIVALHVPPSPWRPFNKLPAVMENYPTVRFYKSRSNLIAAEGVEIPNTLLQNTDHYGDFA